MTLEQANKIRDRVDELNKLYPIKLRYQMICTSLDNFAVTITFNYTEMSGWNFTVSIIFMLKLWISFLDFNLVLKH
jgi:hypothetical protein